MKNIKLDTSNRTKLADDMIKNLGKVSKVDKGEVVANMAISYIKIMNELNKKQIEDLKKTLALFGDIKKEEREEDEKVRLQRIRKELNK